MGGKDAQQVNVTASIYTMRLTRLSKLGAFPLVFLYRDFWWRWGGGPTFPNLFLQASLPAADDVASDWDREIDLPCCFLWNGFLDSHFE